MNNFFRTFLALALAACLTLLPTAATLAAPFAAPVAVSFATAVPVNAQSVIQLQGSDADGTALTFATLSAPSHGALSNLNPSTGAVIYVPTAGYTGSDSFTYKVTSGGADSGTVTVTITVTSGRTRIIDTLTNPDGTPRQGKVTFFLTQIASSPSGLIPAKASVSAALNSSGQFDVSLYPSRAVSPVQFYQAWFDDSVTRNTQLLGIYDIPASTTTISLAGHKVTDANLAAQFVFASKAEVDALTAAVAAATTAQLFPGLTSGRHILWNGTTFAYSAVSESGGNVTVNGNLTVTGTLTAQVDATVSAENITGMLPNSKTSAASANTPDAIVARDASGAFSAGDINSAGTVTAQNIVGNGSGVTGVIAAGTGGGTSSTGALTQRANSDNTGGDGIIDLITTGGHTALRVEDDGTVVIYGPLTGTNLAALVAAAGSSPRWFRVTTPQTISTNLTAPSNITFEVVEGGSLTISNGVTFNPQGAVIAPPTRQIFFNVGAGAGTLSLAGNHFVNEMYPEWFGGLPGDSVDDTPSFNIITTIFTAASKNTGIVGTAAEYKIAGALLDTSASNAQILMPKRAIGGQALTFSIRGPHPPASPWSTSGGMVLRSTLTTGNGAVIGVRNDHGVAPSNANVAAHNMSSNITPHLENLSIVLPVNPTNSGVDLSRTYNPLVRNVRVTTADFTTGGLNPNLILSVIPDVYCTEPTTATSFGIKMPMDFLPNESILDNVAVMGFYNAIRIGEMIRGNHIVIHGAKVGLAVEGATWPSFLYNVTIAATARYVKGVGVNPDLTGLPGANTKNAIYGTFGFENDVTMPWAAAVSGIDDPNCYLKGVLSVFYGAGAALPKNVTCEELLITRPEFPWNTREPGNITGVDLNLSNMAVDLTYRGIQVSDNTGMGWKISACNQLGTNNGCGVFSVVNFAIPNGQDRRLAFIYGQTDGSIKSGMLSFFTMSPGATPSDPGTTYNRALFDHHGNFILYHPLWVNEVEVAVVGNTIAPTQSVVHVQPGLVKNITAPPRTAAGGVPSTITVRLIAQATPFTMDTSGNIAFISHNPAAFEPMDCTLTVATSKWHCK